METALGTLSGEDLARRLEQDIRRRGLAPGSRYLSTRQVSSRYGASVAAAGRAMQALVARGVLQRRDRSGTYIASVLADQPSAATKAVESLLVISSGDRIGFSNVPYEPLIQALHRASPDATIQFGFLPKAEPLDYLHRLLDPAIEAGGLVGVVAMSCPREVYRRLADLRVPAVILGSVDPDQQAVVSIDVDHFQAGRLLAEHLIARGHRRLAMFGVGEGRPGDFHFHEGIIDAMAAAKLPPNALVSRLLPCDTELFDVQARAVLGEEDRPTGLICRGERMVESVASAARALEGDAAQGLEVVFLTFATRHRMQSPFAYAQTRVPFSRVGEQIAELLRRQRDGHAADERTFLLPVELHVPEASPT